MSSQTFAEVAEIRRRLWEILEDAMMFHRPVDLNERLDELILHLDEVLCQLA